MKISLLAFYDKLVLGRPILTLLLVLLITGFFSWFAPDFELDISADSLVLENDKDLNYYRSVLARYSSDDYLIVTYTPKGGLFEAQTLNDLSKLNTHRSQIKVLKQRLHNCLGHIPVHEMTDGDIELYNTLSQDVDIVIITRRP